MHVALGIDVAVKLAARGDAVHELDAADLDQAVAALGVKAGGFGVEDDLAHACPRLANDCAHAHPRQESLERGAALARERCQDHIDLRLRLRGSRRRYPQRNRRGRAFRHRASGARAAARASPASCPAAPARAGAARRRGALTTMVTSTWRRRRSRTAAGSRARRAARRAASRREETRARASRTSGCTMASSRLKRCRVAQAARRRALAGRPAARRGAGKGRLDRRHGGARVERVHLARRRRTPACRSVRKCAAAVDLPMPMRAGEADDQHSAALDVGDDSARSSGVTSGGTPNHFSKPGTA